MSLRLHRLDIGVNMESVGFDRMAIQTDCAGCGALLSVDDYHAGKTAQCPQCGQSYVVPRSPDHDPSLDSNSDWYLQTPEGKTYGPVKRKTLDRWTSEGRVDAECLLRQGSSPWCDAQEIYPVLGTEQPMGFESPFASTSTETPPVLVGRLPNLEPHRGPLVLGLGIAGFLVPCPVLSCVAWIIGNRDLRKMQAGRMDSDGFGLTQTGRVLGMVVTILWLMLVALIVSAGIFLMAVS